MKKLFSIILIIALVCVSIYFAPKLIHKCDDCEKWFIGSGYEASIISDVVSDDDQTICKSCAEKQHAIELALGQSLENFQKALFE